MSGGPRVRSMNVADSEHRPVLGPAGNKARSVPVDTRKPASKPPQRRVEKASECDETNDKKPQSLPIATSFPHPPPRLYVNVPSILRQQDHQVLLRSNLSPNASCSSDTSSDSSRSRGSTGRIGMGRRSGMPIRRKQCGSKMDKIDKVVSESVSVALTDTSPAKKRCAWVTPNTDPCYAAFHDEEWGAPVHDDKKLFELLSLSGALAELTWPTILNKRHIFREVFLDFDPNAVSKLNEKKIAAPGSPASSLLSELKLRAIIENARQMCKIIDEFGSFDKYIWSFVNQKPIVGQFRYPRQVPVKSPKADVISKDLVRRGFRSVGPTVIYSFMQVAGVTNDHLISCFRFQDCIAAAEASEKDDGTKAKVEEKQLEDTTDLGLAKAMDDLSFSSE